MASSVSSTAPVPAAPGSQAPFESARDRVQSQRTDQFLRSLESIRRDKGSTESSTSERREKLREAAEKLEGVVLNLLIKQMRKTVHHSELFKGGKAGEMFRARLDRTYARQLARHHDFGIAEAVFEQLSSDL